MWSVSWGDAPVSRQMLWDYVNTYSSDIYADRQLRLMIDTGGHTIGTVDITDFDPRHGRAMLGIAIDEPWRGQGAATEALRQIIEICKDTLGMHQLAVMVPRDNTPSMRLFEKLGFKTSGCLRSWLRRGKKYEDVVILQLML